MQMYEMSVIAVSIDLFGDAMEAGRQVKYVLYNCGVDYG